MTGPLASQNPKPGRFLDGRDMAYALAAEAVIISASAGLIWWPAARWDLSLLSALLLLWVGQIVVAITFLWFLRRLAPMRPGTYSYAAPRHGTTYVWTLNSFICATNLGILYNHPSLMPSPLKKLFYRALGARLGDGPMLLGGRLTDPHLITVEEGAVIGGDCWLLAHAMARFDTNVLILRPIVVRREAIVGAYSLVMPGVTIGEGASLRAMSYVAMNTTIPPGEVWGGNPAAPRAPRPPRSDS
jgi:hypothetical protein